jgi:hypothetical protein
MKRAELEHILRAAGGVTPFSSTRGLTGWARLPNRRSCNWRIQSLTGSFQRSDGEGVFFMSDFGFMPSSFAMRMSS